MQAPTGTASNVCGRDLTTGGLTYAVSRQVAGLWKGSRFAGGVLLRKHSFLGGHHTLVGTWGVWVGQIRRLLVWLIEHFPSAAGIFPIFLDQLRD